MRNSFYEYYDLTEEERDTLWKQAILVFDTNVLLSLYRLQSDTRNDILAAIANYKDRLWLPNQVGWEFHEHRIEEACKPISALKKLKEQVKDFTTKIENDYSKHPYLKDFNNIKRALTSLNDKIVKMADASISCCPNFLHEDALLDKLSSLYEGKVGKPYTEERLAEIYKIGEDRYDKEVPPGYKDNKKKSGARHRFGDLIIWHQILEKSKDSDCDILFVTDDKKDDWWQMHNGDKIGPRRELVAEFRAFTGNHIIGFYTLDRFLSVAKERKEVSIKKTTIDKMKSSDISLIERESLLSESAQPGQFSTGPFSLGQYNRLGESGPDKLAMSDISGNGGDLISNVKGSVKSPRISDDGSSNPCEMPQRSRSVENRIEEIQQSDETKETDDPSFGEQK